jgi:DNA-binding MarR family transcriptional regulator
MPRTPTEPLPLIAEPGHLIRRAHQRAVALFAEHHGRHITPVQYAVLRAVHAEPGLDQVTLAERVALDTSTTADIAARLEAKGWLHRELLPRRQRSLRLSDEGQAVLDEMLPRVNAMHDDLLAPLSAAERRAFLALLQRVAGLDAAP